MSLIIHDSKYFFKNVAWANEDYNYEKYNFTEEIIDIYDYNIGWIGKNIQKFMKFISNTNNKISSKIFIELFKYKNDDIVNKYIKNIILKNNVDLEKSAKIFNKSDINYFLDSDKIGSSICLNIIINLPNLNDETISSIINKCCDKNKLFYEIMENHLNLLTKYPLIVDIIEDNFYYILLKCHESSLENLVFVYGCQKLQSYIQTSLDKCPNIKLLKKFAKQYNIFYTFNDINNEYAVLLKEYTDPFTEKKIIEHIKGPPLVIGKLERKKNSDVKKVIYEYQTMY